MITLRSLARFTTMSPSAAAATCELCAAPIDEAHRHVVELGQPGVQCVCQPCAILFSRQEPGARFRTIPDRILLDAAFRITPARWAELGIPVALAYCYRDSHRDTGVICYPGPAGVTEAAVEPATWDAICDATALARELEPDVEALLVRGGRGATALACYLVPISTAYELVGRLRACWQGFSGGAEAEREVAQLFAALDQRGART